MLQIKYHIHDLAEYINWLYFFHAWQLGAKFGSIANIHGCDACRASWLSNFSKEEMPKATAAMQLFKEANRMLDLLDRDYLINGETMLVEANSEGDNLILNGITLPLLRQQTAHKAGEPYLCLSDFVRPLSSGVKDTVGLFATCINSEMEHLYDNDPYKRMLVQTLCDRLAEAATEKMHEDVRKDYWGYAPEEHLSKKDLLIENYQGIRPAVGYPSLPDQSIIFLLDKLIDLSQIGIKLTESGAMIPHASVCGLMFAHPQAHYFSVGHIAPDQLADYARRCGKSADEIRPFLTSNISLNIN